MVEKQPTPAELRLWLARIKAEHAVGAPAEEANVVLKQMISSWQSVRDSASGAIGRGGLKACVPCQQIGMEGDLVKDANDLTDLV
ncbi:hypothetical protein [Pararhizobium sp. DWP1-1-3]|uniref:hypothetical protein n=1 Tax=Pararhizobium sp. DWP1-1-3 TaxID=2804652 RepID=UPI003CED5BB2